MLCVVYCPIRSAAVEYIRNSGEEKQADDAKCGSCSFFNTFLLLCTARSAVPFSLG